MQSSRYASQLLALLATSVALLGCATGTHGARATTASARATSAPRPAVCRDKAGLVVSVSPLDLVCKHRDRFSSGSCQGRAPIVLTNCGPKALTVDHITQREIRVAPYTAVTVFRIDKPSLEPGEQRKVVSSHLRAARYRITVQLQGVAATPTATLLVRNPTVAAARERCRACKGDFGGHGMSGIISCLCRMPDADKPCSDGDQCQGKCISTPKGFRCSKHRTVFGCHGYLPRGWSRKPKPKHGLGRRIPSICVD